MGIRSELRKDWLHIRTAIQELRVQPFNFSEAKASLHEIFSHRKQNNSSHVDDVLPMPTVHQAPRIIGDENGTAFDASSIGKNGKDKIHSPNIRQ